MTVMISLIYMFIVFRFYFDLHDLFDLYVFFFDFYDLCFLIV